MPLWSNAFRLCSTQATPASTSTSAAAIQQQSNALDLPDKLYSRVELQMKGIDPEVMKSYAYFAKTAAEHLDIELGKQ